MKTIAFFLLLSVSQLTLAQESSKYQEVDDIFLAMNYQATINNLIDKIIEQRKISYPSIDSYSIKLKINEQVDMNKYFQEMKEVYVKNYTLEELKEMNNYLGSEDLEGFNKKISKIESQLYEIGNRLGKSVSKIIIEESN